MIDDGFSAKLLKTISRYFGRPITHASRPSILMEQFVGNLKLMHATLSPILFCKLSKSLNIPFQPIALMTICLLTTHCRVGRKPQRLNNSKSFLISVTINFIDAKNGLFTVAFYSYPKHLYFPVSCL